jgi:hypothetical protein
VRHLQRLDEPRLEQAGAMVLDSAIDRRTAEHEPTFADIHSTIQRRHAAPYRRWYSREPVDDKFVDLIVRPSSQRCPDDIGNGVQPGG